MLQELHSGINAGRHHRRQYTTRAVYTAGNTPRAMTPLTHREQ